MQKLIKSINLPVSFIREADQFVAYTPALDLSTFGKTLEEAKKNFTEAVAIFFDELTSMGTLEDVLMDLGWERQDSQLIPPSIVSQGLEHVKILAN